MARRTRMSRRIFLGTTTAALAMPAIAGLVGTARAEPRKMTLTAAPTTVSLVGGEWPDTATWAYNGTVPGPEIRVRQGDTVRVVARNNLAEPTTVHWHGIRLPNAMDGVPGVTQDAIPPGEEFLYEFEAIDAGSFWYHPHFNSPEQQGRGLAGALIVEEAEPLAVDRDVTWVLDDWLLRETAQIDDSFGHRGQMSHGGRIGNTVTVNGRIPDVFGVRAGERIRLRLINVANARSFSIDFGDLKPQIIALDGQPVRPHAPSGGSVVVAAAQRVDLVIDMEGKPGDVVQLTDGYYRGRTYEFHKLVYEETPPLRESPLDAPITLAANPLPEPVLDDSAMRQRIVLEGGAMGRFPAGAERFFEQGQFWFVNGLPDKGRKEPLIEIAKGRTCVIELVNQTSWEHPMHLHGFAFRVLTRDGVPNMRKEWLDTVLIRPRQSIEIAFVADSPGDWLFHCHILEHMAAGMSGLVRVA